MNNNKLTSRHLERKAVVYIRQSTQTQVKNNLESQRRQYGLKDKAREMGFNEIEVIDEDLGQSGASSYGRTGFMRLVAMVSIKEVGAVFAIEASRLARNNRDWSHLIDLCSLMGTLIVDHDGIYDPQLLNDRLLLGLKGTMSEFELGLIRQRAQEALKAMVQRGELYTTLPVGYVKTSGNRCEKDPDQRIQNAIHLVFKKFLQLGTVRQVLLWFRQEKIELPSLKYSSGDRLIEWKLPIYNTISRFLKNPIYAGIYAYGKTKTETKVVDGHAKKSKGVRVQKEDWEVFIPNHHEGYITPAIYEKNQLQIGQNVNMKGKITKGAIRQGKSLLSGLFRCKRCGRKLHVTYSGKNGNVPRYHCRGANVNHGEVFCISFGGLAVDKAVESEILNAINANAIQDAIDRQEQLNSAKDEKSKALELALKQAEYEENRAFRQYNAVEPENKLVAVELEKRWNQKLVEVEKLKNELEKVNCEPDWITSEERQMLLSLAEDFPRIWRDEKCDIILKKQLVRILIEEIMVDVDEEKALINMVIHWAGGCHTPLVVKKNRTGQHSKSTDKKIIEIVSELAKLCPDGDIARILNRLHFKTGKGLSWTEGRVRTLRCYRKIPVYSPSVKTEEGWLNMQEAADFLGISPMSMRRLLEEGLVKGRQVVAYSPWIIQRQDIDTEMVKKLAQDIQARYTKKMGE